MGYNRTVRTLLLLGIVSTIGCGSCAKSPSIKDNPRYAIKSRTEVEARLATVVVTSGKPTRVSVGLYLERPEQGVSEGDAGLSQRYPRTIQPRLMYFSTLADTKTDSGRMCDRPRVPHHCELTLKPGEEGREHKRQVKVLFEDQAYGAAEVTVPAVKPMAIPKLLSPAERPPQASTLEMSFVDVGADRYRVTVYLCEPYAGDGINPCLNETEYALERKGKTLVFKPKYPKQTPPTVELAAGVVRLSSSLVLNYSDKVELGVNAHRAEKRAGIDYRWVSGDNSSFKIEKP